MHVFDRDLAVEQADLDRADGGLAVALHVRLDLLGRVALDHRHRSDRSAGHHDDGQRRDESFSHGSASGCLEGCAASNAGCFMQVVWMRWMVGYFAMSTLNRWALNTCGTRHMSAIVGWSPWL